MALVLDTGPLLAAMDRSDQDHIACRQLVLSTREPRIIPSPVLVEVDYWVTARLRDDSFLELLNDIRRGAYEVEDLVPGDYTRIADVCRQYRDANLGFVDAAVLAVTERLGETKLATLDHRHFRMVRPAHVDALTLLP